MRNELSELLKEVLEEIFDEMIQEQLNEKEKETLKIIKRMPKQKRDCIYKTVAGLAKQTNINPEKVFQRLMIYCNEDFEKLADFCNNEEVKLNDCCECIVVKENADDCTIDTNIFFND